MKKLSILAVIAAALLVGTAAFGACVKNTNPSRKNCCDKDNVMQPDGSHKQFQTFVDREMTMDANTFWLAKCKESPGLTNCVFKDPVDNGCASSGSYSN